MNLWNRNWGLAVIAMMTASTLFGCGGGASQTPSSATGGAQRGAVTISVQWPDARAARSRLIPAIAQRIRIDTNDSNGKYEGVASAFLDRPAAGVQTTSVTIDGVPAGTSIFTATAYPSHDDNNPGTALATGSESVTVVENKTTMAPALVMNSTIAKLQAAPPSPSVVAGGAAVTLTASALDKSGHVVLAPDGDFSWSSSNTAIVTVTKTGLTTSLTGVAAGSANITVTESESGVSATFPVSVTAGTGGGGGNSTDKSKIFVVDSGNSRLVGLDAIPATTFTPFPASSPNGVTTDSKGRIYVSAGHSIIRVDDALGTNPVIYTSPTSNAFYVTLDKLGRIYFYGDNFTLSRIDDMSGANLVSYSPTSSFGSHLLNGVSGIAIDSQNRIYVTLSLAGQVMRFDDMTGTNTVLIGTKGTGVNQFRNPAGIAIDGQNRVYVADSGNQRIARFDDANGANWVSFTIASEAGNPSASFDAVAVDTATNPHIYYTDAFNSIVYRMDDMAGANLVRYGSPGSGTGQFKFPDGLAVK